MLRLSDQTMLQRRWPKPFYLNITSVATELAMVDRTMSLTEVMIVGSPTRRMYCLLTLPLPTRLG
jgi:hypothetical protein